MRFLSRATVMLLGLLLAFGAGELLVRQQIPADEDGQRWLGQTRLLPWRFPMQQIHDRLAALDRGETLFLIDPDLGWRPRPGARSRDGKVSIDATGMRDNATPTMPPQDTAAAFRIVTIGDSFTFGDEVSDAETWPAQLERILRSESVPARVFNLGTNAYGIDQAVLRLVRDGTPLRPDVVILGLQPENLMRNVNILRPIFFPDTALPLSKPRFVLDDGDLHLRNHPTLEPDEILKFLEDPESHPLAPDEAWLDERYEEAYWQQSALLSLLAQRLAATGVHRSDSGPGSSPRASAIDRREAEMLQLGTALLAKFAAEAQAIGARPLLVYLPRRAELEAQLAGTELWYGQWLEQVTTDRANDQPRSALPELPILPVLPVLPDHAGGTRHVIVRPEAGMTIVTEELFAPAGHYSARQNLRVAESLALALQPSLRNFRAAARADDAGPVATPVARQ